MPFSLTSCFELIVICTPQLTSCLFQNSNTTLYKLGVRKGMGLHGYGFNVSLLILFSFSKYTHIQAVNYN